MKDIPIDKLESDVASSKQILKTDYYYKTLIQKLNLYQFLYNLVNHRVGSVVEKKKQKKMKTKRILICKWWV